MSGDEAGPVLRPGDAETFRQVWRGFGSTVAVIATEHGAVRHAMLATAVSSVSMDPPSLLVCVNRTASAHAALHGRGAFSLGLMAAPHRDLAAAIAESPSAMRFAHGTWRRLQDADAAIAGLPWLEEAQATLFCATDACHDYGTHSVLIARIAGAIGARTTDPLLYCDGGYGRFAPGEG
ncbi:MULTISPECIES: flavin reductase family protein [Methylobacterium]|uniref:flavin reductase family protein n=1 Tax=Methylobacterium TaxID=407 RepID=UPI0013EAE8F9|nr:flavin reductase family protein [Methylobacterium sp. DB0501]NGM38139.1 flavin reductase family protein [Methylobacterium sp. DB0501]